MGASSRRVEQPLRRRPQCHRSRAWKPELNGKLAPTSGVRILAEEFRINVHESASHKSQEQMLEIIFWLTFGVPFSMEVYSLIVLKLKQQKIKEQHV